LTPASDTKATRSHHGTQSNRGLKYCSNNLL